MLAEPAPETTSDRTPESAALDRIVVDSETLSRIFFVLAIVGFVLIPVAVLVPTAGERSVVISQPAVIGIGYLVATYACRLNRPLAGTMIATATLLVVATSGALSIHQYGAESMALSIIAGGIAVLRVTGRRLWIVLGAVLVVGSFALVVNLTVGPDALRDQAAASGRAISRVLTLGVALSLIGASQRRLTRAMSDRMAVADRLATSEARFRALFASSPQALLIADADGRIVDASTSAASLLREDLDVLRGLSVDEFLAPDQRDGHAAQRAAYARSPSPRHLGAGREVTVRRRDGTTFPADVALSSFTGPSGPLVTVVLVDITSRLAIEAATREANETVRAVVEASPLGIALTDRQGVVRLWNPAMARLTGWHADEVLGRPDPSIPAAHAQQAGERLQRVAAGEPVDVVDETRQRRDGAEFEARITSGVVRDARGQAVAVTHVVEDVSMTRALEAQVNRKARLEAVGQLAGGIAHDINNVLTAIGGFASLVLDDLDNGRPVERDSVVTIAEGAARTSALTRQLLAFARRDVRPAEIVDLGAAVKDVEPMLRGLIGAHVDLQVKVTDTPGTVWVAPSQIEQIVINLVVNARDAMPNGGRIVIEVGHAVVGRAESDRRQLSPGDYVTLTVSDNGEGMAREVAERVFDPFFTTKGPDAGTGLGLSTVHGIVTVADGHVSVESEPGVGTTFRILLPLVVPPEPDAAKPLASGDHDNTETILVVEDDDAVRGFEVTVLERAGFLVLAAATSEAAIEIVREHDGPIDLVISDVVLPRIPGPDLVRLLLEVRPTLRVLFASGYTGGAASTIAAVPDGSAFIDKPFGPDELAVTVRGVLDTAPAVAPPESGRGAPAS